jgi:hypothetical protein
LRVHAGQPVKDGVRKGLGLTRADVDGKRKDERNAQLGGAAARLALEAFGNGLHAVAPKATSIALKRQIGAHVAAGRDVVVDGLRTPVEAETIKAMGGEVWRAENGTKPDRDLPTDHMQAKIKADRTVDMSGGKKESRGRVDAALMEALGG